MIVLLAEHGPLAAGTISILLVARWLWFAKEAAASLRIAAGGLVAIGAGIALGIIDLDVGRLWQLVDLGIELLAAVLEVVRGGVA